MAVDTRIEGFGPVLTSPRAPIAFHVMAKPTGAICKLACEYCFFLSKGMLYPGSRFRMAEQLQETYIRQLLDAHARAPEGRGRMAVSPRSWAWSSSAARSSCGATTPSRGRGS
jgi:hypothetical protein